MNRGLRIVLTVFLVLLLLFCTIAIVGALNLGPNEKINTGRFIAIIIGELIAVVGLVRLWRGRGAGTAGPVV